MIERLQFFAPCPKGVEPLLADEFRRLGLHGVRPQRSGVLFAGSVSDALKALMWTRLASRILMTLGSVPATSAEELHAAVAEMPWEDHVRAGGTIAVDASGTNAALRNTQFTAVKVKDAVADRFREKFGRRPSVDVQAPDLRMNVAVRESTATISIDLAGEPLHRRGYREPGVQVAAPMKETLAAAVLEFAGWRSIAAEGGAFVDPLCGSGTLAIEAALAAADIAPGLIRRGAPPASRWLGWDQGAWERLSVQASERREAGLLGIGTIAASDWDPRAVELARSCVRRAGLESRVTVERADLADLKPPSSTMGLVAVNPPWGERLSERSALPALYATLSEKLMPAFAGWRLAVASPDTALSRGIGLPAQDRRVLGTGKGAVTVTLFDLAEESRPAGDAGASVPPVADASEFANRLAKMAKHYGKWARRTGVGCYRVYDADLPDFAVAVDVYEGAGPDEGKRWAHVAEYAAPAEIDEAKALARLQAAVESVAGVLEIDRDSVFLKRRERQRGAAQYERVSSESVRGIVAENGLLFEVNFSDYLDTGLFLDHRDTRAWIRELAEGQRFLNMFAYTGTATVYAAAGGAASTMTTDLSPTYLEWAERNLERNGLDGANHLYIQRDAWEFIERAKKRGDFYDLVFCDPPTFSNSKRTNSTWDVQRDHAELIGAIKDILAEKGAILFSCNRRGFTLDSDALAGLGLNARDVTARTIPKDFERHPHVHRCWKIGRA